MRIELSTPLTVVVTSAWDSLINMMKSLNLCQVKTVAINRKSYKFTVNLAVLF